MLAALPLLLLPVLALPAVRVLPPGPGGCSRVVTQDGAPLRWPAPVCVRDAWIARLEDDDTVHVVAVVDMSGDRRLFVYTLEGARLAPRFLGSGFTSVGVTGARRARVDGWDVVEVAGRRGGEPVVLHCRFQGFPLVCQER